MAEQTLENTLTLERTINASVARVYDALTNPMSLREWLCAGATLSGAEEGGAFFLTWNGGYYATATILKLEENAKVKFAWQGRDEEAFKVKFLIEANAETTNVTFKTNGETENVKWERALDNLVASLETGLDERITKRAILGVIPTTFDENIAKDLGIPVSEGFRFSGLVPGCGAEAVGLQANDVIVSINGLEIANGFGVGQALAGKLAGDEIDVEYYRGADKHSVTFPLSSVPLPEIPETKEAFADQLQEIYEQLDQELLDIYEGVSEEEASQAPADGEWSANETLGHLVGTERWLQEWIGSLINGQELQSFSSHQYERGVAFAQAFVGKDAVIAEMRKAQAETVALLRALPDALVNDRKATYIRIGLNALGLPNHNRNHFQQMQSAIKVAKGE